MVTDEPEVLAPADDVVVCAQVVSPEEGLSAQFDGVGQEVEEGNPDGGLKEHGQTAAHGTYAILAVDLHHFLLLLHGVLLLGIFLAEGVNLGFQHTHLGAAHVALLGGGINQYLHDEGEQQQHNAHGQTPSVQPVEEIEDEEAVDPLEQGPAKVDDVFQLQVGLQGSLLVGVLEDVEVVGTHVHLHQCGLGTVDVECGLHGSLKVLQHAFIAHRSFGLLVSDALQGGVSEVLMADEDAAEELVLESHPVQGRFHLLALVSGFAQVVHAFALFLIGEAAVVVLKVEALLQHLGVLLPLQVDGLGVGLKVFTHLAGLYTDVQHI